MPWYRIMARGEAIAEFEVEAESAAHALARWNSDDGRLDAEQAKRIEVYLVWYDRVPHYGLPPWPERSGPLVFLDYWRALGNAEWISRTAYKVWLEVVVPDIAPGIRDTLESWVDKSAERTWASMRT